MTRRHSSRNALWILQAALAALFLFAGGFKLAMPMTQLAHVSPLPAAFLKFIGVCEVLGGLGLVLPGALHLHTRLTPLAAAGLVVIMLGAVVVTASTQGAAAAGFPLLVGVLTSVVALARRSPAPRTA
jgi:uncharacterized membrane protein YphA (DoxX/SURF4 family)